MNAQNAIQRVTKPLTDLVLLNAETTGQILLRQNAVFGQLVEQSVAQTRRMTAVSGVREAVESQREYLRTVGETLRTAQQDNLETLRNAGKSAVDVIRGAIRPQDEPVAGNDEFVAPAI